MTEQVAQPVQEPDKFAQLDKDFEAQKQKDVDTFRKYGLQTKEDVQAQVKEVHAFYEKKFADMETKFETLKEWVMRAKQQGFNSGVTEDSKNEPSIVDRTKPAWR